MRSWKPSTLPNSLSRNQGISPVSQKTPGFRLDSESQIAAQTP